MAATTKSGSGDTGVVAPHPHLEWAQRKDKVWITVVLENCKDLKYDLKEDTFHFRGKGGTDNLVHEVTLPLYGKINVDTSKYHHLNDRQILFTLMKSEDSSSFWPRLTMERKKFHFLKTDFNRWKDEDDTEEEEEKEEFNLDQMMNSMGGLNGTDFGGAPEDEQEADSDDEELPDLQ